MTNIPRDLEDKKKILYKIIDRELTPLQKDHLIKYYGQGMTLQQIADERGVYPSTVHRIILSARNRINRFLLLDDDTPVTSIKVLYRDSYVNHDGKRQTKNKK